MKDKDRYWDCLDQAMEASHGGRTEEALAWLEEALKASPEGAEAHNGRGEILWDDGRVEEALHEFELASRSDPKFITAHLNRAEILIDELGEYEQALTLCDQLLAGKGDLPRPDKGMEAEIYYLKSKALFYTDDLEGALFLVRRALKTGGDQGIYRAFEGQILFELGRFKEARPPLETAVVMEPDAAQTHYHLGLVLERLGENEEAARRFEKASQIEPEQFPVPLKMSDEDFEHAAAEAMAELPRSIREYVENVPVLIEEWPAVEFVLGENVSPTILGIFLGVPRTQAGAADQPRDMDRVILFKRNLETHCRDREELVQEIQTTLKHEIGHYLGLDEDDLERLGLA
jgi:predicted Zn-dependent protease with MMP-like domain/Flp pilus assembly protein TadD